MSVKTAQSTLRVAVYSLVCYDGEKDPVSLAAQRDRYAKKLAENPNWVITEWFSDEITFDESEETPANFQRMLQRCREGKIDIILTKSVLRFARDAQGTITRVRELRDLGVSVIFEREDIDSRSPDCEQLITLYFDFIRKDAETISNHICNGHPHLYMKHNWTIRGWIAHQFLKRGIVVNLWPSKRRFIKRNVKGGSIK